MSRTNRGESARGRFLARSPINFVSGKLKQTDDKILPWIRPEDREGANRPPKQSRAARSGFLEMLDVGELMNLRHIAGADGAGDDLPRTLFRRDKAVHNVTRVVGISRRRTVRIDTEDEDTIARARNVEGVEFAIRSAHKAVIHVGVVHVPSGDPSLRIDAEGISSLKGVRNTASAGSVEAEKIAALIPQKTVTDVV